MRTFRNLGQAQSSRSVQSSSGSSLKAELASCLRSEPVALLPSTFSGTRTGLCRSATICNAEQLVRSITMGIVIDAEPVETMDVKLVGVDYKITPPKTSLLMEVTDKMQGKNEEDVTSEDLYRFVDLMFTKTDATDRKSTRLNSSHVSISYA